jgi:hypothetical protein
MWIGDHIEHLKTKLEALHYDTLHCVDVLLEVIAPEVVAHLIASNLGIQYDEALNVLKDKAAWEYGEMIDNTPEFIRKRIIHAALRIAYITLNCYSGAANCGSYKYSSGRFQTNRLSSIVKVI